MKKATADFLPKKAHKVELFDVINITVLILLSLTILYPFYNSIIVSIISHTEYTRTPFLLFPKQPTFDAYQFLLSDKSLYTGYRSTLLILLVGVPINMLLTVCASYVLSRKSFLGKKLFFYMILITMFFQGGLIPTYLVVKDLNITNTLWSVILVYGMNTFNFIVTRNYFQSIPSEIEESAKIDGANDIVILWRIFVPLAKPILATIFLFYSVDRWNEWFYSMLFIKKQSLIPLQLFLRNIVNVTLYESSSVSYESDVAYFAEGVKMAAIVLTMLPIMLVYPFVQKYFVKGIMVGAVKA